MSIDEVLKELPEGFKFHVGHTPHWYRGDAIPRHLRKRPFEAYVVAGIIGTSTWIFESADGASPAEALATAISQARARAPGVRGKSHA